MGDADESYDFCQLQLFLERLRQGYALVLGNRFQGGIRPGAMPWLHRYVGNPLLTGLLNLLFHSSIYDTQCGLRAFRREAYERWGLTSPGMEFASEMVVQACLQGDPITEVPIILYPDGRGRRPHLRPFRDGWRNLCLLVGRRLFRQCEPKGKRGEVRMRPDHRVFDESHYASTLRRKIMRSLQLGPKYYFWHLPRYWLRRRELRLPWRDLAAAFLPFREFRRTGAVPFAPPAGYSRALNFLETAGVRITLPPSRLEALVGAWWTTIAVPGHIIECGCYRGATALLLALLGRLHQLRQSVLLVDTFTGSPSPCRYDFSRNRGEFGLPANQISIIRDQAATLGVLDRIEIHRGLFAEVFENLRRRDVHFAFVHIDANLYQGTAEACAFTIPRMSAGGMVVFDDYNGACDLGARLAIDQFLAEKGLKPLPLTGSSAYLRIQPKDVP